MHGQSATQAEWWKTGIVYQIYPLSFQDSSGNGKGDLRGIEKRLDYVQRLGVEAVWLSPVYPSPMHDNGYDVADYRDINPLFGTLDDFDRLLEKMHQRGLKLIIDLVPNHTSDQHPWFQESRSSRHNPKRDWYIWADPKPDGSTPNNWLSVFGGPAWTLDERTGQYYLHQFVTQQPELNYRNPQVLEAMLDNMRFWLRRGVDGFRVDVIWLMLKDERLRDEPPNPDWDGVNPFDSLIHCYTQDVDGIHQLIRAFRRTVDEFDDRYMVGEIYLPLEKLVRYYGEDLDECHQPFNFHLVETSWEAASVRAMVERYESLLPPGAWPCYVASNHDRHRSASRVGKRQARCANMLLLTLRGTPTVYYGEELGLENVPIPKEKWNDPIAHLQPELVDAMARDQVRTPMLWERGPNAGFCPPSAEPWLPLHADHGRLSVQSQEKDDASHLALFRRLAGLRRAEPALHLGHYRTLAVEAPGVYAYERSFPQSERFAVCLNFDSEAKRVDLSREAGHAEIVLSTRLDRSGPADLSRLQLRADEGLIVKLKD
ncbi:MAG TPA: alpha-amylase family glycosyl hydrolase [Acidobacteriota bacterium]|nr:alpha-amylase family glycosyl hydrolase [Acidobacteriota bacterium]